MLEVAGSSLQKVLKVNIYVTSMSDVPLMNEAYVKVFQEPRPVSTEHNTFCGVEMADGSLRKFQARACVCVKDLARGTDVEIECIAHV